MAKLKIGVIGVGSISREHRNGYMRLPDDVELYAFCDINKERLESAGREHGVDRLFTDYHEMLALPELDAVSVCVWNSMHAPITIAALNAGKHVLCEKPMATSVEDAIAMQQAAEKNGKLLMIGFVRRYGDDANVLKDFIANDYLGELYYGKVTYIRRNGCPGGWFGDKSRSGGGPLIDLGVHMIDFSRYAMGNPKPVSVYGVTFHKLGDRKYLKSAKGYTASSATAKDPFDVEDMATAMIRYDNGALVTLETSFSLNIKEDLNKIELYGTKGGAVLDPELHIYNETNGYLSNLSLNINTAPDFGHMFRAEIKHFVDCIKNGTECRSPAKDGVEIMRILMAIYRSAETGHEVVIE